MRIDRGAWLASLAFLLLPAAAGAQGEPPQPGGALPAEAQPAPPPEEQAAPPAGSQPAQATPPRLSYTDGEVSFWRPGAGDWTPARVNTPLAPGDSLYAGPGANLEVQIGPRAFVRGAADTEIGLEDNEPDYQQLKITSGQASLDLRRIARGQTVEVDTPQGAFTIDRAGYYRVNVDKDSTAFITRRGGSATVTPASGEAVDVQPSEEIVLTGTGQPQMATYVAPDLDPWDRWNYGRTDHLLDPVSARYVPQGVYGTDDLDHYGNWRTVPDYGSMWVPDAMPSGWAPYSAGRWISDPYYGWTWVDDAPWGWAPYHYGRWAHVGGFWGWVPGPIVVAPAYAPALVAWFGVPGLSIGVNLGGPALGWCALGWGEPVIPWWGGAGFVGAPWWGGWGGPRIVNNVVIERNTIVNVRNITVYRNAGVRNAIVAVPRDQFGRGTARRFRLTPAQARQVTPIAGRIGETRSAASFAPGVGRARRPPAAVRTRAVVATRAPKITSPAGRGGGTALGKAAPAPRLVSAPQRLHPGQAQRRPAMGPDHRAPVRPRPPPPPQFGTSRRALPRGGQVHAPRERAAVRGTPPSERAPRPSRDFGAPPAAPRRPRALPGEPANRMRPPSSSFGRSARPAPPAARMGPIGGGGYGHHAGRSGGRRPAR